MIWVKIFIFLPDWFLYLILRCAVMSLQWFLFYKYNALKLHILHTLLVITKAWKHLNNKIHYNKEYFLINTKQKMISHIEIICIKNNLRIYVICFSYFILFFAYVIKLTAEQWSLEVFCGKEIVHFAASHLRWRGSFYKEF